MKQLFVIGSNGFIGSHIVNWFSNPNRPVIRLFYEFFQIFPITRENLNLFNYEELEEFFIHNNINSESVIINCASSGGSRIHKDSLSDTYNNLAIFFNILNIAEKYHCGFINFGSGVQSSNTIKFNTSTPYALSKMIMHNSFCLVDKAKFCEFKLYNVFGINELSSRFITSNILRYIKEEPMIIHQNKIMDFYYINDLMLQIEDVINDFPIQNKEICKLKKSAVYKNKTDLIEICDIINNLDKHKVNIILESSQKGNDYFEFYNEQRPSYDNSKLFGLKNGIIEMFNNFVSNIEK